MKVKYSRFRHNAKQTSFTSPTGPLRWWARACARSNKWWCHVRLKLFSPRKRLYLKFPNIDVTTATDFSKPFFFKMSIFSKRRFYFFFCWLNYYITLNLALFYQSYHNCQWNPSFLVTSLKKKKKHVVSLMWPEWQMLSEVFNRVHFSRNFIFRRLFCFRSILKYSDYIRFLSKMEYI